MPKFYPVSSFGNGEFIDCIPADFPDMEDLSPADRKGEPDRKIKRGFATKKKE